jgi:hypothetical protein
MICPHKLRCLPAKILVKRDDFQVLFTIYLYHYK